MFGRSLARPGAQPCGARRAERLGRSAGPGQRRLRRRCCQRRTLLHLAANRSIPGVACRWRPLPFLARAWHARSPPCNQSLRLGRRRNFPKRKPTSPVLDAQASSPSLAHQHFAPRRRIVPAAPVDLEIAIPVAHHPVLAHRAFRLQPENLVQFRRPWCAPVIVFCANRRARETQVVFRQIFIPQIYVRRFLANDLFPP